jgi:F-type H+-transporting ATPase subunit gamma
MKLVSAAKLKRAQDAALAGRAFSLEIQRSLLMAIENLPEGYTHPFLQKPLSKGPELAVVISADKGLCGAFNANIVKSAATVSKTSQFLLVGRKAVQASKRFNWKELAVFEGLPEDVAKWPVEELAKVAIEAETKVSIFYTQFVSAMTQAPKSESLLPLDPAEMRARLESEGISLLAKIDPSPVEVFEYLAPLYIRARLREAALESKASEHAARMTAMDAATNNASELIERLRLFYNRARQASITTELIDIIGGASAVE